MMSDEEMVRAIENHSDSALVVMPAGQFYPAEITEPLRDALGMMIFKTGPIAEAMRELWGSDIPKRVEFEQAAVLHWAIKLALEHGEAWTDIGNELLRTPTISLEQFKTYHGAKALARAKELAGWKFDKVAHYFSEFATELEGKPC